MNEKKAFKKPISPQFFTYLALIPIMFVLLGYVVFPLFTTFISSVFIDGQFSLANYGKFFSLETTANLESLFTSLFISIISVISCGVVGISMAFLLEKFEFPGRRILKVFAILPMALPSLIGSYSFSFLYGESGIVPRTLQALFNLQEVPFYIHGISGVLVVHTFTMYPYYFLMVSAALKSFDYSLEEAAYGLGASKFKVFKKVTLPVITPSIVAASILVFMISMASYTAPLIFGIDRTMTMQIVLSRTNGNLDMASTQATILAIVSVSFLIIMRKYEKRRNYTSVSKGVSSNRIEIKNPLTKIFTVSLTLLLSLILAAPILVIILISFSVDGTWTTQILPPVYTFSHYIELFTDPDTWNPIYNSLVFSLVATGLNLVFGLATAYIVSRRDFKWKGLVDTLVMIPWALPGTVVALNLITAFNTPSAFSFGQVLVGTVYILPIAYFVRHLPLVHRSTCASFSQTDVSSEEAARSLGGSWWYSFRKVVFPMAFAGIMSGVLLSFVQGFGEFVSSILLYTPNYVPLSVAINQELYSFKFGTACAYGVLQIGFLVVVLFINEKINGEKSSIL